MGKIVKVQEQFFGYFEEKKLNFVEDPLKTPSLDKKMSWRNLPPPPPKTEIILAGRVGVPVKKADHPP